MSQDAKLTRAVCKHVETGTTPVRVTVCERKSERGELRARKEGGNAESLRLLPQIALTAFARPSASATGRLTHRHPAVALAGAVCFGTTDCFARQLAVVVLARVLVFVTLASEEPTVRSSRLTSRHSARCSG